jgi:hypothetical protein
MSPRTAGIIAGGVVALLAAAWSYRAYLRSRPSSEELERRRRKALNAIGKIGDGTIVELQEKIIFYSYDVRGIEYMASQDVTALEALIPTDPWSLAGPVSVKYDPRNPANSIILSEEWTGIRKAKTTL